MKKEIEDSPLLSIIIMLALNMRGKTCQSEILS